MARPATQESSSWIKLLVLFTFASLIETIFYGQFNAFTPLYLPKLGIEPADVARWTGIIAAATGLIGLPFLPFWGALADRFSRKPVVLRSFAVEALSGFIACLAGNIWVFMIGRTLTSMALGNTGLMMTTLSERAPANRQGLAFSIMNTASPVGIFIGPLIGGPIVDHWGFQTLLGIDGALLALVVLMLGIGYRDLFVGSDRQPILKMAGDSIRIIAFSPRLRSLFPALIALQAGRMLAQTYVSLVISQIYTGAGLATMIGIILGTGGIVAMVFTPIFGILADRFGLWQVLLIGTVAQALVWPLPLLTRTVVGFTVAWSIINGLASGIFALTFIVLANSTTTAARGRIMSFSYLPSSIGLFLGPAIGSLITRSNVFMIFPASAVFTAAAILLFAITRKYPVSEPPSGV
ncbi:MAG TPA: MFS transporter [Anaerolineaceae bacterium]|nr:MFS transporter [Anaerolineaceae bacterium]